MQFPQLRRPEHTGENRCRPCTLVNAVILLLLVGVVSRRSPVVAFVLGLIGAAVILLRGYLVPFTPRFAPAIAAALPGEFFEHDAPGTSDALSDLETDDTDPESVLRSLVAAGVVAAADEHLEVTADFEAAWQERMDALAAGSDEDLVASARAASESIATARIERTGSETFLVVSGADGSTGWLRRPVAIAEIAAIEALHDTDLPAAHRELAADALGAFLETCPVCGDDVVEAPLDDCCGHTVPDPGYEAPDVLACETCGVVFHQFE